MTFLLSRASKHLTFRSYKRTSILRRLENAMSWSRTQPQLGHDDIVHRTTTMCRGLATGEGKRHRRQQRVASHSEAQASSSFQKPSAVAMLPMAVVPVMFLLWGVSNYYLNNRQLRLNEELRQKFEAEYAENNRDELEALPILFHCIIRRTQGFTHCLSNIQVGDVVEVLAEGVGPNREYNLCRFPAAEHQPHARDTIGWFPIRWLQKLQDYERMIERASK